MLCARCEGTLTIYPHTVHATLTLYPHTVHGTLTVYPHTVHGTLTVYPHTVHTVHTPHRSQYAAITLTTPCTASTYLLSTKCVIFNQVLAVAP